MVVGSSFAGAFMGLLVGGRSAVSAVSEPGVRDGRLATNPAPMAVASERTVSSSSLSARLILASASPFRAFANVAVMLDRSGRAGSVGRAGLLASSSAGCR